MELLHTPARILAALLVADGKAVYDEASSTPSKWTVFTSVVPDTPNKLLCIYNTQGVKEHREMGSRKTFVLVGYQVMTRSLTDGASGWMAMQLAKYFDSIARETVDIPAESVEGISLASSQYLLHCIIQTSPVMTAGQDERRRFLNTINGMLKVTQLSP